MITSSKFNSDTLSHTTNVVPLVHIEKTIDAQVNRLGFSTQQLDFTDIDDSDLFYSPLLLSMPSLSESIDFESKKYKISSVTLKLSNMEYLGEILSDKYNLLLNSIVTVWYKTQSANTLEECLKVYTGKATRITHDYDVVSITLEDKSQSKLHRDVPIEKLSEEDGVLEKYRNKPIPMVYGHVEKSPLVFTDNYQTLQADKLDIQFYKELNDFGVVFDSLWMDVGHYINVMKTSQYIEEENKIKITASSMPLQSDEGELSIVESFLKCLDASKNYKVTLSNSLYDDTETTEEFEEGSPGSVNKLSDSSYDINEINWSGFNNIGATGSETFTGIRKANDIILFYDSNDGSLAIDFRSVCGVGIAGESEARYEFLLLKLGFEFLPQYDTEEIDGDPVHLVGMAINGVNLSTIAPFNEAGNPANGYVIQVNSDEGNDPFLGDVIDGVSTGELEGSKDYSQYHSLGDLYNHQYAQWLLVNYLFDFKNTNVDGVTGELYAPDQNVSTNPDAAIHFQADYSFNASTAMVNLSLTGNISEIDLLREVHASKVYKKDFYANVIGRSHEDILVYRGFEAVFRTTDRFGNEWIKQLPFYNDDQLSYGKFTNHNIEYIFFELNNVRLCVFNPDFIEISRAVSSYDAIGEYYPSGIQNYVKMKFSGRLYQFDDNVGNLYLLTEEPDLSVIDGMTIYFKEVLDDEVSEYATFIPNHPTDNMLNLNYGTIGLAEKDKPSDIMLDILQNECNYTDGVSENEIIEVRESHDKWKFAFTQHKSIDSKKLIEEFSESTKSLPRFRGVDGKFVWNTVKDEYTEDDIDLTIKSEDVIKYSYDKTKIEGVKTKVRVKYFNDYADDELKKETSYISVDDLTYQEGGYNYGYYGLDENDEDSVLEFESKYIRDKYTAEQLRNFLLCFNMNQHNFIKATLPLVYANLEVGDVVVFDKEIQGLKLYGETYTTNIGLNDDGFVVDLNKTYRNGQEIYPYFMVYKTKKNIDKIEIELIQLHKNDPNLFLIPLDDGGDVSLPSGDVNLDGNVNVLDIVATVGFVLGTTQLTPDQGFQADLNEDGSIDVLDIVQLVTYILG